MREFEHSSARLSERKGMEGVQPLLPGVSPVEALAKTEVQGWGASPTPAKKRFA